MNGTRRDELRSDLVDLTTPEGYLVFLARCAEADTSVPDRAPDEFAWLAPEFVTSALELHLPAALPVQPAEQQVWLDWAERLALAVAGADRLAAAHIACPGHEEMIRHLAQLRTALFASEQLRTLGAQAARQPERFPWTVILEACSRPLTEAAANEELLVAWIAGRLGAEDSAHLRDAVQRPGPWQRFYREALQHRVRRLIGLRSQAVWMLDVVHGAEAQLARPALCVPLPHLGEDAQLRGYVHAQGVWWCEPGGCRLLDASTRSVSWGDAVTGPLMTELLIDEANALDDAHGARLALARLEEAPAAARALAVSIPIAQELASGELGRRLLQAAEGVTAGSTQTDDKLWTRYAFAARVGLERTAAALQAPELEHALMGADEALRAGGPALDLLDEDYILELLDTVGGSGDTWWSYPSGDELRLALGKLDALIADHAGDLQAVGDAAEEQDIAHFIAWGRNGLAIRARAASDPEFRARLLSAIDAHQGPLSAQARKTRGDALPPASEGPPALRLVAAPHDTKGTRIDLGSLEPVAATVQLDVTSSGVTLLVFDHYRVVKSARLGDSAARFEASTQQWTVRVDPWSAEKELFVEDRDGAQFSVMLAL